MEDKLLLVTGPTFEHKLLTLPEVAAYFRTTRSTIYRWMKIQGFPQPLRAGRSVRFLARDIESYCIRNVYGGDGK